MPVIEEDELGPWMDLGHGAIRPVGPTRFKLGEELDEFHLGGSTLHGVGKIEGKPGCCKEAWLDAPKPRELHERDQLGRPKERRVDYDYAIDYYFRDMSAFKRGNPAFDPGARLQNMPQLQVGRARYRGHIGMDATSNQITIEKEMRAEGEAMARLIRARWEGLKIDAEAAGPSAPAKGGLRM